jgi:RimJ/RimL family protein N-acetyltransferase
MATDVGGALIRWAFTETPLDVVHWFAHAENAASRRVLEKLGTTGCGQRRWNGMPTVVYAVSRGEADIIWPRERHRNAPRA